MKYLILCFFASSFFWNLSADEGPDYTIKTGVFSASCKAASNLGDVAFTTGIKSLEVNEEGNLEVDSALRVYTCARSRSISQANQWVYAFSAQDLDQDQNLMMVNWKFGFLKSKLLKGRARVSRNLKSSAVKLIFPLDDSGLSKRTLKKIAKGKSVKQKFSIHYVNKKMSQKRDMSRGYYELVVRISQNDDGEKSADLVEFTKIAL